MDTPWTELEFECVNCTRCELWKTRKNVVFGEGNKQASVLFVGEGPGENEDLQGLPFVGKAGQLLDDMLKIIDLDRHKNCYITNTVKCRPPKNRDPQEFELEACSPWLNRQMELLKPEIIVCLGRIAAKRLINSDFKITSQHGQIYEKNNIKYMAMYHPSALLRDESKRPETFVDLKELQKLIRNICPWVYN